MDAARAAVSKFTSKMGHTTDVEETVRPAVVQEVIKPHRHEETVQAVDREVHQDHYHTTVQPIAHREVVPEVHKHNVAPVQRREFEHDDRDETHRRVSAELSGFKNTQVVQQVTSTQEIAPTVTGEHVHHHVHETVQPVIHKEVIRPEVVHTVIPIHETHHAHAEYHGMSALPMKTLDEFKKMGGSLTGGTTTTGEHYEGQPRQYNPALETTFEKLGLAGQHGTHGTTSTTGTGVGTGHHTGHHGAGLGAGAAGVGAAGAGAGLAGRHRSGSSSSSSSSDVSTGGTRTKKTKTKKRGGLLDKLNPRTDADGDGRTGFGR